ncbi:hypothetical protein CHS0354_005910, partial [Potamilus streckersoni]
TILHYHFDENFQAAQEATPRRLQIFSGSLFGRGWEYNSTLLCCSPSQIYTRSPATDIRTCIEQCNVC